MHPRPDLTVLQCAEDEVQIGLDPRWSIRINNLTKLQVQCLLLLPVTALISAQQVATLGEPLLQTLHAAGALLPTEHPSPTSPSQVNPDARPWSHLRPDAHGTQTIESRRERTVAILGLGRTGLRIGQCLATAGVGRLVLDDDQPVAHTDLGLGGYTLRDLTISRRLCASRLVAESSVGGSAVQVGPLTDGTNLDSLDIVVVIEHGAIDPARMWRLIAEQVPHLPIVWGEAGASIGPVVLPGRTPCLRCVDLTRRDTDPAWPLIVAQLNNASSADAVEESLVASMASAIAVSHVLAVLDGRAPGRPGSAVEISLPDATPRFRQWLPHSECGCFDLAV